jgi:hypothetical protein
VAKPHTRTPRRTQVIPNRLADFLAARLAFFSTAISSELTHNVDGQKCPSYLMRAETLRILERTNAMSRAELTRVRSVLCLLAELQLYSDQPFSSIPSPKDSMCVRVVPM